jgi:hypothetical protein
LHLDGKPHLCVEDTCTTWACVQARSEQRHPFLTCGQWSIQIRTNHFSVPAFSCQPSTNNRRTVTTWCAICIQL